MLAHKLRGLHQAQEVLGVAANAAGGDLVDLDLAVGVNDEGAALGKAVGGDQDLEALGQDVGGVSEHGVGHLGDALGLVVPGLVDKVGVAGHGVDLAALSLEGVVVLSQLLELGGAHKGEVRGIEEEQGPLAQDVSLGDGLELAILEGLDGKIADFLVDEGHVTLLLCVGGCLRTTIGTETYYRQLRKYFKREFRLFRRRSTSSPYPSRSLAVFENRVSRQLGKCGGRFSETTKEWWAEVAAARG